MKRAFRRLKCRKNGHQWVNRSIHFLGGYGWVEYRDQCMVCDKKRVEKVQEH